MLQDDFDELMKKFENADPSTMNLEEAMSQINGFFGRLKREIIEASPEEREAIFANLSQMYTRLTGLTQKMASKLGMSEQQLMGLAEDMRFFSPEQKQLIEKTKKQMMSDAQDLADVLKQQTGEGEKPAIGPQPPKPKKDEGPKPPHQGTRSKWMRS